MEGKEKEIAKNMRRKEADLDELGKPWPFVLSTHSEALYLKALFIRCQN
jgi:hypothetical protein